jgi:hypothetical protein
MDVKINYTLLYISHKWMNDSNDYDDYNDYNDDDDDVTHNKYKILYTPLL